MSVKLCCAILLVLSVLMIALPVHPQIIDRVVAYVDDYAITMFEIRETKKEFSDKNIEMNSEEILNSIINRVLLSKEAKKMRLDASETKELINEYIDIKIRSLIFVKEEDIKRFYEENKSTFGDMPLSSLKDSIEKYLIELEVNKRLKEHLLELRKRSNIVINSKIGQGD